MLGELSIVVSTLPLYFIVFLLLREPPAQLSQIFRSLFQVTKRDTSRLKNLGLDKF